jgi:hypothetical protein
MKLVAFSAIILVGHYPKQLAHQDNCMIFAMIVFVFFTTKQANLQESDR